MSGVFVGKCRALAQLAKAVRREETFSGLFLRFDWGVQTLAEVSQLL